MLYFIDTANIEEIKLANELGIISGVTTNPSLIAKEGRDVVEVIREIVNIVDGPISAEVISLDKDGMVNEGREYSKMHENIVVKLPMTEEGLKACSILTSEGIKVNMTLIFSSTQALAAARAGATYVSPFIGRLDDVGQDGIELIEDISDIFLIHNMDTKIIAASIRNKTHISRSALAGAHIATVPYKVLIDSLKHPLTDAGIEKFLEDYKRGK